MESSPSSSSVASRTYRGTRFADKGRWTTFFRVVRADGETRAESVLWRADGSYLGTAIGPTSDFPGYVLVPTERNAYAVVERGPPWRWLTVRFDDGCLLVRERRVCSSSIRRVEASAPT